MSYPAAPQAMAGWSAFVQERIRCIVKVQGFTTIGPNTVKQFVRLAMSKMGVSARVGMVSKSSAAP